MVTLLIGLQLQNRAAAEKSVDDHRKWSKSVSGARHGSRRCWMDGRRRWLVSNLRRIPIGPTGGISERTAIRKHDEQ